MFKKINFNGHLKKYSNYKLCFIEPIEETIYVDSPETVAFMKTKDYKILKATDPHWYYDRRFRSIEVPNPEFDWHKITHQAYFTPLSLDEQWGDDWNDAMTGSYHDTPYDDYNHEPIEILVMPFCLNIHPYNEDDDHYYRQWTMPNDITEYKSVQDVNRGMLPWLYAESPDGKDFIIIHAGASPYEFANKLKYFKRKHSLE